MESRSRIAKRTASKPLPHREVSGLLRDPRRIWVLVDAENVHPSEPELDGEEDVQRAEPRRLHGEEVEGQDRVSLRPEELAPRGTHPARGRAKAVPAKDRADRRGRDRDAELQQLTADPEVAPPRVLPRQASDELYRRRDAESPERSPVVAVDGDLRLVDKVRALVDHGSRAAANGERLELCELVGG